jgi:hypothetical protein
MHWGVQRGPSVGVLLRDSSECRRAGEQWNMTSVLKTLVLKHSNPPPLAPGMLVRLHT